MQGFYLADALDINIENNPPGTYRSNFTDKITRHFNVRIFIEVTDYIKGQGTAILLAWSNRIWNSCV